MTKKKTKKATKKKVAKKVVKKIEPVIEAPKTGEVTGPAPRNQAPEKVTKKLPTAAISQDITEMTLVQIMKFIKEKFKTELRQKQLTEAADIIYDRFGGR